MDGFYKNHNFKKSGDGPGGKFNGPKCKTIINEDSLNELENLLRADSAPLIAFIMSIREIHRVCVTSDFIENE